jgi:hypothetical protein
MSRVELVGVGVTCSATLSRLAAVAVQSQWGTVNGANSGVLCFIDETTLVSYSTVRRYRGYVARRIRCDDDGVINVLPHSPSPADIDVHRVRSN